ncbi:hypothetical protein [Actinomadura parmotrematis]|uniref:Integral membrane protein n=1 Tax=Actinomadura parmotrematis TaxID=2864039 RepID=A0ABS7FRN9_9ACTN|nr:hypothetical protein [Actinomadura parmotrematis]MBW8482394.1 hypothetical protein [Actinomadura parmotrematis]
MDLAALVTWVLTASAGLYLLVVWIVNGGGLRGQATKVTRFPVAVLVGHPSAAVVGLAVWIGYLWSGAAALAWTAFGALLVTIVQGVLLFTRWLVGRGGRHARGIEQPFPAVAVIAHGVVAATTLVLVLVTAILATRH